MSTASVSSRLHALIPAAGSGSRVGAALPKQYLKLGSMTMLEHSVGVLAGDARLAQVLVVVAPDDDRAARLPGLNRPRVRVAKVGGATRAASVRAGLDALGASDDDWVLVHDAARPCLSAAELGRLVETLREHPIGGLLAVPLADTLKRAAGDDLAPEVAATVDRSRLWRAATPQMFRIGLLRRALDLPAAIDRVTDEASAVEQLGHAPRLVAGAPTNLKVTSADDLPLAEAILAMQGRLQ